MSQIYQTRACCAVYELAHIVNDKPTKTAVEEHLKSARTLGGSLPLVILFTDNDQNHFVGGGKTSINYGEAWCSLIREMGYRVDKIVLGNNPKHDGNTVTMYNWYAFLGKKGQGKSEDTKVVKKVARKRTTSDSSSLARPAPRKPKSQDSPATASNRRYSWF